MRRYRRRPPARRLWLRKLLLLTVIFGAALSYVFVRLQPVVLSYADNLVQDTMTVLISEVVQKQLSEHRTAYEGLVKLQRDSGSHVTALQTNMVDMDQLKAQVTKEVSLELNHLETSRLSIPLGSVLAPTWQGGRGPKLHVGFTGLGTVKAEFASSFRAAGINQTRHNIVLNVQAETELLTFFGVKKVTVTSSFYVTDIVIVGTVPERYTTISGNTEAGNARILGEVEDYADGN